MIGKMYELKKFYNRIDKQNQENIQKNLENIAQMEGTNKSKDINEKVGDINGNMEVSQAADAKTKNDISKDKQSNSK